MRKPLLIVLVCVGAAGLVLWVAAAELDAGKSTYPFTLPELGYAYSALEPHLDARTMEIHHSKHHAGYVKKLNAALKDHPEMHKLSLEVLLDNVPALPVEIQEAVRNNGGGHFSHSLFWQVIKPGGKKEPQGKLLEAIKKEFGSVEAFKEKFTSTAASHFASGWAWLAMDSSGTLKVYSTPGHDTPVMKGEMPLMVVDVWEHAYYLKYQNRRADFLESFWNVINWDVVGTNYEKAQAVIKKR